MQEFLDIVRDTAPRIKHNDIAVNCFLCGDKRKRLHLKDNKFVKCFNGGCYFNTAISYKRFKKEFGQPNQEISIQNPFYNFESRDSKGIESRDSKGIEYLKKRKVLGTLKEFNLDFDATNEIVSFFIENKNLEKIGSSTRWINEKRFYITKNIPFKIFNYSRVLNFLESQKNLTKFEVYITEGIFDALSIMPLVSTAKEPNTIALLGSSCPFEMMDRLAILGCSFRLLLDNDAAGVHGSLQFLMKYKERCSVLIYDDYSKKCDFNDIICNSSDAEILKFKEQLLDENNYKRGIKALHHLLNLNFK